MGEGDFMPVGRHRRRYDPDYAKKLREGGKKAAEIRKKASRHHGAIEVPKAEEQLLKDLEALEKKNGGKD